MQNAVWSSAWVYFVAVKGMGAISFEKRFRTETINITKTITAVI
jgi:hypothetical protein